MAAPRDQEESPVRARRIGHATGWFALREFPQYQEASESVFARLTLGSVNPRARKTESSLIEIDGAEAGNSNPDRLAAISS